MRTITVLLLAATASFAGPKSLYGIRWHDSVPEAVKASKGKKPIFWLRMLGDLAGKT
jgi:hypothetical protein